MPITQFPNPPTTISGTVTIAGGPSPLPVQLDLAPTDDDGNPYVSLWPDSDPPTGTMQEAMRRLLAQMALDAAPPVTMPGLFGQITGTGAILGPLLLNGATRITIAQSGTYGAATVTPEVSIDGTNWVGIRPVRPNLMFLESGPSFALPANSTQGTIVDTAGWIYFRYRCIAFTSGLLNVAIQPSFPATSPVSIAMAVGTAAEGAGQTGTPVRIAGSDTGGLIRTLTTDVNGQLIVNQGVPGASPWPVTLSSPVTTTPPAQPLPVTADGQTLDDDGNPYVSLWPDSDPPTGSLQEAMRRLLAQLVAGQQQPFAIAPTIGVFQVNGDIVGPVTLRGATRVTTLISGTYGALTYGHEVSMDGVTWVGVRSTRQNSTFIEAGTAVGLGANTTQANNADVGDWIYYRARCTAFVSGQANILIAPSYGPSTVLLNAVVTGGAAEAAGIVGFPVRVSGADAGNLTRTLLTDTNGSQIVNQLPATTTITGTAAVSTGVTLTIPAAGAGLFNYLVALEISLYVSTSVTGAATPVAVTTTGITGTPSYSIASGTSAVVGALLDRILLQPGMAIKGSAANTAMVFTAPIVTGAIWRLTAYYYTGP